MSTGQPTGAGHKLGATAVVRLKVMTTDGEQLHQVPCYVLESTKPIWNGELKNCAMVLGINALEDLSICIISNGGTKVMPKRTVEPKDKTNESKLSVVDPSKLKEKTDKSSVTKSSKQLRSKVKRKAMESKVKHHFWWKSRVKANI